MDNHDLRRLLYAACEYVAQNCDAFPGIRRCHVLPQVKMTPESKKDSDTLTHN